MPEKTSFVSVGVLAFFGGALIGSLISSARAKSKYGSIQPTVQFGKPEGEYACVFVDLVTLFLRHLSVPRPPPRD